MGETLLNCPHCEVALKLPGALPAGARLQCPKCAVTFAIPEQEFQSVPSSRTEPGVQDDSEALPAPSVSRRRRTDRVFDGDEEFDDEFEEEYSDRRRRRPRRPTPPSGAVTAVGVVTLILSALRGLSGLVLALCGVMFGLVGNAAAPNVPNNAAAGPLPAGAMAVGAIFLAAIGVMVCLLAVLSVIAGIGVLRRREWARITTLVLAGLESLGLLFVVLCMVLAPSPIWAMSLLISGGYVVLCFVVLLKRQNAAEFT